MYYRIGTTGAQTITVTFSGAPDVSTLALRSYCGVAQTSTLGTPATSTGGFDATNPTVSVTSSAGDMVIDAVMLFGDSTATLTVNGTQTQRANFFDNRDSFVQADSDKAAAAAMSWTKNVNNTWAMVTVALKPTAGAVTQPKRRVVVVQ
jgi:hypothetical protein